MSVRWGKVRETREQIARDAEAYAAKRIEPTAAAIVKKLGARLGR